MKWLIVLLTGLMMAETSGPIPFSPAYYEAEQTHGAVQMETIGDGLHRAYLFVPAEPALGAGLVPVVCFHHGWQGMNPKNYGAQIDHLVRSGYVVVYPTYQDADSTNPQTVEANAAGAETAALAVLHDRFQQDADPARVLYYGYSMGAAISVRLAIDYARFGLPGPRAMMLAAPGDAKHVARGVQAATLYGDVERLPKDLPVAIVTGADDKGIGLPTALGLFPRLCAGGGKAERVLMVLPSGTHEGKTVNAGHASPGAPDSRYEFPLDGGAVSKVIAGREGFEASGSLNQLDFGGYWQVMDLLLAGMGKGSGVGPVSARLGVWGDGSGYPEARVERCK